MASSIQLITGYRSGCAKEGLYALLIILYLLYSLNLSPSNMCLFMQLNTWCWDSQETYADKIYIFHLIHLSCGLVHACALTFPVFYLLYLSVIKTVYKYKNMKV